MHLYAMFVFIGATASCLGMVQDNFLLVTDSTGSLFQIDLSTESAWKIPLSPQRNPIAVAYDPMDSKVYWTDVVEKRIKRSNLDGTTEEVVSLLYLSSVPDGMAIDIASRLVYYTDTGIDIIGVMTLDGSQHLTLLTENMTEPRAIVLHPEMGLMYWTDWGSAPKIEVAAMDGTQRRILLNLKSQSWPNGLALDTVGKRLYWCDGHHGTIESVALDGSSRTILTTIPGAHFYGIVVVAPNVYFTEWNSKNVSTFIVSDPYPIPKRVGPNIFGRPNGLAFYSRTHYERDRHMNSSCSNQNGGCEHICLATPNGPRCACPDGLNFINGTKCSLRTNTCPQVYTATKGQIRSPGYPGYKNNLHCSIVIRKSNPNEVQRRIRLYVEDFDLQEKYDYLLIGTNKFTGTQLTRYHTYTVSTSAVDVSMLFITDHSTVGRGFIFVYAIHNIVNCNSNRRCHNGGTCINGEYCLCRDGFEGDWCDNVTDHCASNPCQNGGTCVDKSGAFECKCVGYYRGSLCEYDTFTCRSNPCMNSGSCHSLFDAYRCDCTAGYSGSVCETFTDHCASNPCQNGGTCVDKSGAFECKCVGYYRGSLCEYDTFTCRSNPCMNSGSCHSLFDAYWCDCTAGYSGSVCETSNMCKVIPCQNGGLCSELDGVKNCKCIDGSTGKNCEHSWMDTVPASMMKRINISIKLKDAIFKTTLADKHSKEYQILRNNVETALTHIVDDMLGRGKYTFVDVTFSAGSLLVTYTIEALKDAPSTSTIETAIKQYNGSFAGFEIDTHSVKISELSTNTPRPPSTKDMTVATIGIIVGSLLGLGLGLGLVIGGVVYCVRKINIFRETQDEEDDANTDHTYASLQFNNRAYDCRNDS